MRLSFCIQFLVMLCVMGCVFHVANTYERVQKKTRRLDAGIMQEHENIRVLQAEWAYLTNPVRLEKIASDYLKLEAMDGRQLVALAAIPLYTSFEEETPAGPVQLAMNEDMLPEDLARYIMENSMPTPMPLLPALEPMLVSHQQGVQ